MRENSDIMISAQAEPLISHLWRLFTRVVFTQVCSTPTLRLYETVENSSAMKTPKHSISIILLFLLCAMTICAQSSHDPHHDASSAVSSERFSELDWFPCPEPLNFEGCHIAILHGDPGKQNADVLFRMQPGTTAPEHWHTSAERMILISGEMHVTYQGEDTHILKAGSYAYGPAEKSHVAVCVGEEPCVMFIAFEKPVDTYIDGK